MRIALWILILLILNCQKTIQNTDEKIKYISDRLTYDGEDFTGIVESELEAVSIKKKSPYKDGLLDGTETETFSSGELSSLRVYEEGKYTGTHKGWYPDGSQRFIYEYKDGNKDGEFWEWSPTGKLYSYARFENDNLIGKKVWRENGQIFINLVSKDNQVRGLIGGQLCRQVRSDSDGKTGRY